MKLIINAKKIYSNILKQGKMRFKKMVPIYSWFHAKKPTSGFEVPTGNGKVPYAIARVELYAYIFKV